MSSFNIPGASYIFHAGCDLRPLEHVNLAGAILIISGTQNLKDLRHLNLAGATLTLNTSSIDLQDLSEVDLRGAQVHLNGKVAVSSPLCRSWDHLTHLSDDSANILPTAPPFLEKNHRSYSSHPSPRQSSLLLLLLLPLLLAFLQSLVSNLPLLFCTMAYWEGQLLSSVLHRPNDRSIPSGFFDAQTFPFAHSNYR